MTGDGLDAAAQHLVRLNLASTHTAALVYANEGWPVFPVAGIVAGSCGCRLLAACTHPAKHPLLRNGLHGATIDPQLIDRWWQRWPWAGVAIATGARSALVVIDVDPRHGGEHSLADLQERGVNLPDTLTVRTGGGGRHLFFRHRGPALPNSAGRLAGLGEPPGVDLRGDGGYVVAPPSPHVSEQRYQWDDNSLLPAAALPSWAQHRPAPANDQRSAISDQRKSNVDARPATPRPHWKARSERYRQRRKRPATPP